jgi:uncharacterized protein YsxB (DUF464 family)
VITVAVKRKQGRVTGFHVTGHAGLAPKGKDILCAAVSAITQTALLGLKETPGVVISDSIDSGNLACEICSVKDEEAAVRVDAITGTMLLGLLNIEKTHAKNLKIIQSDIQEVSTCS